MNARRRRCSPSSRPLPPRTATPAHAWRTRPKSIKPCATCYERLGTARRAIRGRRAPSTTCWRRRSRQRRQARRLLPDRTARLAAARAGGRRFARRRRLAQPPPAQLHQRRRRRRLAAAALADLGSGKLPDPCEGVDGNDGGYGYTAGYLPAGNDLPGLGAGGTFTEEEAQTLCRNSPKCRGFTYSAPTRDQNREAHRALQELRRRRERGAGWHARFARSSRCATRRCRCRRRRRCACASTCCARSRRCTSCTTS